MIYETGLHEIVVDPSEKVGRQCAEEEKLENIDCQTNLGGERKMGSLLKCSFPIRMCRAGISYCENSYHKEGEAEEQGEDSKRLPTSHLCNDLLGSQRCFNITITSETSLGQDIIGRR